MKKLIKIIFILIIIILIISGITFLLLKSEFISKFLDSKLNNSEITKVDFNSSLDNIEIDLGITNLNIYIDDEFKIETNNKKLLFKEEEGKIVIKEKESLLKSGIKDKILNIYLPRKDYFNNMDISSKAGAISIEDLSLREMELSLVAGSIEINNLEISNEIEVEGGTGEIIINNCKINNLDFESGIGKSYINGILIGNSKIQTGVGEFNLDLQDNEDNYQININAGLGEFKIGDTLVSKKTTYGTGSNHIYIKSGVGDVNINLKKE